jgi:Antibiotic biosynthesis monooxygenase
MDAFNVVRFRVKPGREPEFLDLHRTIKPEFPGLMHAHLVKTGDRNYCFIGQWDSFDSIVASRPAMVGNALDRLRDLLEDLGGGLGVTDPVSGEVAVVLKS